MRKRKVVSAAVITILGIAIWLCVRFPYEIGASVTALLGTSGRIDPLTLHLQGEFVESNLGTAVEPDGSITVRLIAQQYNFVPACTIVPIGVPIRFRVTSADVVHRLGFPDSGQELEVVPGHVSEEKVQFTSAGEHVIPCNEFCGAGHWDMRSRVMAVPGDQFSKLQPQERLTCASR